MIGELVGAFLTIFVAEMGDKTQFATLSLASSGKYHWSVAFLVSASALVAATAIAVAGGKLLSTYMEFIPMRLVAAVGFIGLGLYNIYEHFYK